jgi:soluble lytic murein transglycosylase
MHRFCSIFLLAFTLTYAPFHFQTTASAAVPLPVKKSSKEKVSGVKVTEKSSKSVKEKAKPQAPLKLSLNDKLSALNDLQLTADDKTLLNKAVKAVYKNKKETAETLINKISDPTAKKLAQWYAYRNRKIIHDYDELTDFIKSHPSWPSRSRVVSKIEARLYKGALPAKETDLYFQKHKPKSLEGKSAHAEALFKLGKKKEATELIRTSWHNPRLPAYLEKFILDKFPLMLRPEDHKIRVDRLLYLHKKGRANAAVRTAKKLGAQQEAAARFRAAVVKRQFRHATRLFSKLADKTKAWPGVHLSRIELERRSKKYDHAIKLMVSAKYKAKDILNKDQWWVERRKLTRYAISEKKYDVAYKIASGHKGPSVNKYNEAEFLSGWLALQFLNKPKLAEKHFENFKQAADGPRTRSKSAYWMGRTQQKLKNTKKS